MEQWKSIAIEAIRKEILTLISDKKLALIKAGPGKDKDITAVVDDLHTEIGLRIDTIKRIEEI